MTGAPDQLRVALGDWWRAAGCPPVEQLTDAQAAVVLAQIEGLHWQTRPFTPEPT